MPAILALIAATATTLLACSSTSGSPTTSGPPWDTYTNADLHLSLQYPADWVPHPPNPRRYEGPDGFFQLEAAAGNGASLDVVAQSHASHVLQPFGSQPSISALVVDGQPARLIWPSDDQPAAMNGQAELLVQTPGPIQFESRMYDYLVLYADKDHVLAIAQTMQLAGPGGAGP